MKVMTFCVLGVVGASGAQAGDWGFRLGAAYVSGISKVADHYEDNLRRAGYDVDINVQFPLGLGAAATYVWSSDVRADIALGPTFFISGDVHHFELPVSATLGYTFFSNMTYSPYVRAGVVYHYVDGDQYASSDPGLLVAIGLEFTRFGLELATDRSEVALDELSCNGAGACTLSTRKLNTYGVIASVFYRF